MAKKQKPKAPPPRLLTGDDLRARGIDYSTNHLRILWKRGDFPKPIAISPRRLVWREDAINEWLNDRIRQGA